MVSSKPKHNRQSILALKEMAHVQEALMAGAEAAQAQGKPFDLFRPIRAASDRSGSPAMSGQWCG